MAFVGVLAAIGAAVSVAGTVMSVVGSQQAAKAQKKQSQMQALAIEEQKKAEEVRRKQMQMDARRKRMAVIREQQLARATALNNATNQGADGGSGLPGGYGQIAGQTGTAQAGINAAEAFGNRIFDHNAASAGYYQQVAYYGGKAADAGSLQSLGQGISSLGGAIYRNSGTIARVGGWA